MSPTIWQPYSTESGASRWPDSAPIQVVFCHPTLHFRPHVSPSPASSLTTSSDPKRCPAEFSPLPLGLEYRTIVLMQETLNSPIALSQSRNKNERVLYATLHNVTKCYTVTRGPPDETLRPVSPDCHPAKGTALGPIPSAQRLGFGSESRNPGTPDLPDHQIRNATRCATHLPLPTVAW